MWRSCCSVMISPRPGRLPPAGSAGFCALAATAASSGIVSASMNSRFINFSLEREKASAQWHQRAATALRVGGLAGLVQRRTGFYRGEPGLDRLDPVARSARGAVVGEHGLVAVEIAIGLQKFLRRIVERGRKADRRLQVFGEGRIGVRVGMDHAGVHGGISVERVELEIAAAALGESK